MVFYEKLNKNNIQAKNYFFNYNNGVSNKKAQLPREKIFIHGCYYYN